MTSSSFFYPNSTSDKTPACSVSLVLLYKIVLCKSFKYQMPFRSQPQRLVPFSECKSTAFLHNHQTFFALFSRPFRRKYAHFMHKALKNSRFTPRKNFSTFLTADCKCEKKMRLLQEKGLQIAPNMLNNIFIALRTPPVPSPAPQNAPGPPTSRPPHAPCTQMTQERFLHSIHCMPCRVLQQREAVEQNADAVGKSVHGGGSFFHGVGTFFHGFYF